jgi:phage tail sheath protein FI
VDKPPSVQLLRDMSAGMQAYFDSMKKLGALVGGRVWLDPERNTPQQTSQGIWAWDMDPEPVAPMEHIQNYAHRNTDYYNQLVAAVAAALNGTA